MKMHLRLSLWACEHHCVWCKAFETMSIFKIYLTPNKLFLIKNMSFNFLLVYKYSLLKINIAEISKGMFQFFSNFVALFLYFDYLFWELKHYVSSFFAISGETVLRFFEVQSGHA